MDDFEHRVHVDSGRVRYPGQEAIARLRAEVERLTAVVKAANAQAEHFERQWYLRGDEVEALRADADRYRWIDEHCLIVDRVADSDNFVQVWAGDRRFYGRTLEAAIDAARAAQGGKT